MRVIGVLDVQRGRAVHARAGRRDAYQPLTSVAGVPIPSGDVGAVASVYVERLGLRELYAADLDALSGCAPQDALVARLAGVGASLLVDCGVTSLGRARRVLALGADRVIVALETLSSYEALAAICAAVGGERVAFSLDLRGGAPVVASGRVPRGELPHVLAARAKDAGAGTLIVIDLARVGGGTGVDLELIGRVREAARGLTLLAGGGVRGVADLEHLADAGCDGALVATALHDGRIGADEIAAAHRYSFTR